MANEDPATPSPPHEWTRVRDKAPTCRRCGIQVFLRDDERLERLEDIKVGEGRSLFRFNVPSTWRRLLTCDEELAIIVLADVFEVDPIT